MWGLRLSGILHSLDSGECDLAIVRDDGPSKPPSAMPLLTDALQGVCAAGHPLARVIQNTVQSEGLHMPAGVQKIATP